jgi:hypothetical protein
MVIPSDVHDQIVFPWRFGGLEPGEDCCAGDAGGDGFWRRKGVPPIFLV